MEVTSGLAIAKYGNRERENRGSHPQVHDTHGRVRNKEERGRRDKPGGQKFPKFPSSLFLSWELASPLVLSIPKVPMHLNYSYVAVRKENAGQEQGLQK